MTRKPRLVDLVDDPVYRVFILPEYQAEWQQAVQANLCTEQLAARLRALGLADDVE